jgi:hypothetical protein
MCKGIQMWERLKIKTDICKIENKINKATKVEDKLKESPVKSHNTQPAALQFYMGIKSGNTLLK